MTRGKANVLITSASRKVSLVQAFQRAARAEGGGLVVAVDMNPLSAALHAADRAYLVPGSRDPAFLPTLLKLVKRHRIRAIVPTRDEELPLFALHREAFAEQGATVMVASPETVERCQDKRRFLEFCVGHGFGVPRIYADAGKVPARGFPVFVRSRTGKGSRQAFKVATAKGLRVAMAEISEPIIQEFISAPEFTVDAFLDFGSRVISVVPRERVVVLGGESFVGRIVRDPVLVERASALACGLGLVGHNTVQCFVDGSDVRFIEVNPRFGGGASIGFAAGAPTPRFLVRLALGRPVPGRVGKYREGVIGLRYVADTFVREKDVDRVRRAP